MFRESCCLIGEETSKRVLETFTWFWLTLITCLLSKHVFSHVFAFTVLQNMPNPAETLKEFKIVAKRDARLCGYWVESGNSVGGFGRYLWRLLGLQVVSLRDDDTLRCYVVTAVQR